MIDTFDDYYNHQRISKWFAYDNVIEKVSKRPKNSLAPVKSYEKRDQFLEADRNIVSNHNKAHDSSKKISSNAKSFVTRQNKKMLRERVEQ